MFNGSIRWLIESTLVHMYIQLKLRCKSSNNICISCAGVCMNETKKGDKRGMANMPKSTGEWIGMAGSWWLGDAVR